MLEQKNCPFLWIVLLTLEIVDVNYCWFRRGGTDNPSNFGGKHRSCGIALFLNEKIR